MVNDGSAQETPGNVKYVPKGPPREKRHRGGKKGARKPSQLLKDMRKVYRSPDDDPKQTPGQAALRKMLKESPEQFMTQLGRLETSMRALTKDQEAPKGATTGGSVAADAASVIASAKASRI